MKGLCVIIVLFSFLSNGMYAMEEFVQLALHKAVREDDIESLQSILNPDVNGKDRDGNAPLHRAVENCCVGSAQLLLEHGAQVDVRGQYDETPLYKALEKDALDKMEGRYTDGMCIIKLLVNSKANVDGAILHQAVCSDREQVLEFLLSDDAMVNITDNCGRTLLHTACGHALCPHGVVTFLLNHNADVNIADRKGCTPLHAICESFRWRFRDDYCLGVLQSLINSKADVNGRDNEGSTPLHKVAKMHLDKIITFLLKHGADPKARDMQGRTPADVAQHEAIKNLLDDAITKERQ